MTTRLSEIHSREACMKAMLPVTDALEVLRGKWKLAIISSLMWNDKRFGELADDVPNITDRMLSKELKDLEANDLVKRTIHHTFPVTVVYSLTEHGQTLRGIINELRAWGTTHREHIIGKHKNINTLK